MASRRIKGTESVSKRRWKQERRKGGKRRGGGRDGREKGGPEDVTDK